MIRLSTDELVATSRAATRASVYQAVENFQAELSPAAREAIEKTGTGSINIDVTFMTIFRHWLYIIGSFYEEPRLVKLVESINNLVGRDIDNLNLAGLGGLVDGAKLEEVEKHPSYKNLGSRVE